MPRGVKGSGTGAPRRQKKTTDERIADVDKAIEAHKNQIAELTSQKKDLLESKELERTNELLKAINATGMSPDQLLELVEKNKESK